MEMGNGENIVDQRDKIEEAGISILTSGVVDVHASRFVGEVPEEVDRGI